MSDTRNKIIDDLQDAAHPEQAEHTPVLLWGRLADWVIADRQKLLDELLAEPAMQVPDDISKYSGVIRGALAERKDVRAIIEKKRREIQ